MTEQRFIDHWFIQFVSKYKIGAVGNSSDLDKGLEDISDLYMEIIKKAKKSLCSQEKTPWIKKGDINFDVGMEPLTVVIAATSLVCFPFTSWASKSQGLPLAYTDMMVSASGSSLHD